MWSCTRAWAWRQQGCCSYPWGRESMASSHPTSSSSDLDFLSWVTSTDGYSDGFTSQTFNVLHYAGIAVTFVWILTLALTPVCQRCLSLISSYFKLLNIKNWSFSDMASPPDSPPWSPRRKTTFLPVNPPSRGQSLPTERIHLSEERHIYRSHILLNKFVQNSFKWTFPTYTRFLRLSVRPSECINL